ncbi:hypothetical protein T439DRAFT_328339 [Meredithblackwellia eburnea MCA 4105]
MSSKQSAQNRGGMFPLIPIQASELPLSTSPAFAAYKTELIKLTTSFVRQLPPNDTWIPSRRFQLSSGSTSSSPRDIVVDTYQQAGPSPMMDVVQNGRVVRTDSGVKWHARCSSHEGQGSRWEQWKEALLKNFPKRQLDYVDGCTEARRLQVLEEGLLEVWQITHSLRWPRSERDYVILVLTLDTSPTTKEQGDHKSFRIVAFPAEHPDAPVRPGVLRGTFGSVDHVSIKDPNEPLIWRSAVAWNNGGGTPQAIVNLSSASTLAEQVPRFLNGLRRFDHPDPNAPPILRPPPLPVMRPWIPPPQEPGYLPGIISRRDEKTRREENGPYSSQEGQRPQETAVA